jgi:hypothetical protein
MWGYPEQFMPVPGGAYIHPDALGGSGHRQAPPPPKPPGPDSTTKKRVEARS